MFDIICITNRRICGSDRFLSQIEQIARCHPGAIILREKDLEQESYLKLAHEVQELCQKNQTPFYAHSFWNENLKQVHLPMHLFLNLTEQEKQHFSRIGVSCHSIEEAILAEQMGADYIIAGHIFQTDCKKGLPPRGTDFLKKICNVLHIPVYAIGGITPNNIKEIQECGASGACIMSSLMTTSDPKALISKLKEQAYA